MRKFAVVVGLLSFFAIPALAGEIYSFDPASIHVNSGEWMINIWGANMTGTYGTWVTFDGPGGVYTLKASTSDANILRVWVPTQVVENAGAYTVTLHGIAEPSGPPATPVSGPATFYVTSDGTPPARPVLTLPPRVTAEATSPGGAIVTYSTFSNYPPVTCDHASGSGFAFGGTTVNCSATNGLGTTYGSFPVYVVDTTPPVLTLPHGIVVSATSADGAVVNFTTSALDIVDSNITPICSMESGSLFPIGTTTVNCIATDRHLNEARGSFDVTVTAGPPTDTTPPQLFLPAPITAEAVDAAGATVTYTAHAVDNVDGEVPITCYPPSGSVFGIGTQTVQCTATDAHQNIANGTFTVTVQDTTPPELVLPSDITVDATDADGTVVYFAAEAHDIVYRTVPVVCTPPSGSLFAIGDTRVDCSATDRSGNTARGSFTIHVVQESSDPDTTPPVIQHVAASPNVLSPANHQMVAVTITFEATDDRPGALVGHIVSVASNQPPNTTADGNTQIDWVITGPLTLNLRAERTANTNEDRVYTITIQVSDAAGNTSLGTTTVRVPRTKTRAVSR